MIKEVISVFAFHDQQEGNENEYDYLVLAESVEEAREALKKYFFSEYFWGGEKINEKEAWKYYGNYKGPNTIEKLSLYADISRRGHVISSYGIYYNEENDWWEGKKWQQ